MQNMANSYGLKGKGVDLTQERPKRQRDVVGIPAVIETPLVPAENAPSRSGWQSNVGVLLNFMMSFLGIVFSWVFPRKDVVRMSAAIATPLVPAANAPSSSGWHSNVVLLLHLFMSFLWTVVSGALPSYMLNFHFSLFFKILFGC